MTAADRTEPHDTPARLHASAIAFGETGILIRGSSGSGKSNLAHALIVLGNQAGLFSRLVGDDRIEIAAANRRLIARGHPAIPGMIEVRGQGLMELPAEPAVVLRLVLDLLPTAEIRRYPDPSDESVELCGVKLRRLALPCERSSYDCGLLVMAALHQHGPAGHTETI